MQMISLVRTQFGAFLWGIPIPRLGEEQRFVRWLNDEWVDPVPAIEKYERGEGPYPDLPNKEDAPARRTITREFLPNLIRVQTNPRDKKTLPGLVKMLRKHSIVPTIPTPVQPAALLASGRNMTEVWAMHVLLQMASDGALKKLALCACGCEKWFMRNRTVDRFATDPCRVRFHQRDPAFKEQRRIKARDRYRQEHRRAITNGRRKERAPAPRNARAR